MKVPARKLRVGDAIGNVEVESVYIDPDGVWVNWSDGDSGYVDGKITITRECEGHETDRGDLMGESFYCDGSCT